MARYQYFPKKSHLEAVKRIFQYLKSTTNLVDPKRYSDVDFLPVIVPIERAQVELVIFLDIVLYPDLVKNKIQSLLSLGEAEYIVLGCCYA